MQRKAKIICTIGPVTINGAMIRGLIKSGMNVARLNFSHGTHAFHEEAVKTIRHESARLKKNVAIMLDLQGIKIRLGTLRGGQVELKKGRVVTIRRGGGPGDENTIYIRYPHLIEASEEGQRVLLSDGLIELQITEKGTDYLTASVKTGGILKEKKGVNLPGLKPLDVSFTKKDEADLLFGLKMGIDYVALSFVRTGSDVLALKEFLKRQNANGLPVIAKIETPQAIRNLDEILPLVDGIMVARGDLGVEIPPENVPVAQKSIVEKANRAGKFVIIATEMLESMTERPRPTRAETTDVSNAILDGADAVMLSQETSVGKYPLEAAGMMGRIIEETELSLPIISRYQQKGTFSEAVARAATDAAHSVKAKYIIAFTQSGSTARLISMLRPYTEIIALSPSEHVLRRMALYWGVRARKIKKLKSMDAQFKEVEKALVSDRLAKTGDIIVITAGVPNQQGTTRLMKLHVIGKE
ncbi:MAG: pyruvate kinase [Actinomycetota bacterium]|nr:pyruvate kinase [Actinomycetota bacterium]